MHYAHDAEHLSASTPLFSVPFIIRADVALRFSITENLRRLRHIPSCLRPRRMLSLFPLLRLGQRRVYITELLPWQQTRPCCESQPS